MFFLFFACLAPAVAFGGMLGIATSGAMGTIEASFVHDAPFSSRISLFVKLTLLHSMTAVVAVTIWFIWIVFDAKEEVTGVPFAL